ncbi:MAG: hypothetical protein ACKVQU_28085 [Burkholderiales bacterium]
MMSKTETQMGHRKSCEIFGVAVLLWAASAMNAIATGADYRFTPQETAKSIASINPSSADLQKLETTDVATPTLGSSFHALTGTWSARNCFDRSVVLEAENRILTGGATVQLKVNLIDTFESLKEKSDLSAYAAARYGAYSGSFNYAELIEKSRSSNAVYAVLEFRTDFLPRTADFSASQLDKGLPNRTSKEFVKICGTHYVKGIGYGVSLRAILKAERLTEEEHKNFSGKLSGGYQDGTGSVDFAGSVNRFLDFVSISNKVNFEVIQNGTREICGSARDANSYMATILDAKTTGQSKLTAMVSCATIMSGAVKGGLDSAQKRFEGCQKEIPSRSCRLADYDGVTLPIFYQMEPTTSLDAPAVTELFQLTQRALTASLTTLEAIAELKRFREYREQLEPRLTEQEILILDAQVTEFKGYEKAATDLAERCASEMANRGISPRCDPAKAKIQMVDKRDVRSKWSAGRREWSNIETSPFYPRRPRRTVLGALGPKEKASISVRGSIWHRDRDVSNNPFALDLWEWCRTASLKKLLFCQVIVMRPNGTEETVGWSENGGIRRAPVISGPATAVFFQPVYAMDNPPGEALPDRSSRCSENSGRNFRIAASAALSLLEDSATEIVPDAIDKCR